MTETFVVKSRRLLIRIGKLLPFFLCLIVAVGYAETIYALVANNYVLYNNDITLNTPISFWVGKIFIYDWVTLSIIVLIGFAIETCRWHKIATAYLALQIYERDLIASVELEEYTILEIAIANLIVSIYLVYKGIKTITK